MTTLGTGAIFERLLDILVVDENTVYELVPGRLAGLTGNVSNVTAGLTFSTTGGSTEDILLILEGTM